MNISFDTLKCESTFNFTHCESLFFCFKCNEVICNNCLINHLCLSYHNLHTIIKVEEAYEKTKTNLTTLLEKGRRLSMQNSRQKSSNPLESILAQKENEVKKTLLSITDAMNIFHDKVNNLFEVKKREYVQMINDNSSKDNKPSMYAELQRISNEWEKMNHIEKISHMKEFFKYEEKLNEELTKPKGGNENVYGKQKKQGDDLKKEIEDLNVNAFEAMIKRELNEMIKKINKLVMTSEKEMDSSDEEIPDKMMGMKNIDKQKKMFITTDTTEPKINEIKKVEFSYSASNKNHNTKITSFLQAKSSSESLPQFKVIHQEPQSNPLAQLLPSIIPEQNQPKNPINHQENQQTEQSTNTNSPIAGYPYDGTAIFTFFAKNIATKPSQDLICYRDQQISKIKLTQDNFHNCYSPNFPFHNMKAVNLGNGLLIAGGSIDNVVTNKTYLLRAIGSNPITITSFQPMITNREGHTLLFIPRKNTVIAVSGSFEASCEMAEISSPSNEWIELPKLRTVRGNATLFVMNDNTIACLGGFNRVTNQYVEGYELLNLDCLDEGWRNCTINDTLPGLSTMGVIHLTPTKILLLGGFNGGNTYKKDGYVINVDEHNGIGDIELRQNILSKGVIFFYSETFYQIGNEFVNFDFKNNLWKFDMNKEELTMFLTS